jgi:hypothetical protein
MSRSTRPMLSVAREPNGRRSRALTRSAPEFAPTEVKRLRDAALAGMQNPEWAVNLAGCYSPGSLSRSFMLRASTGRNAQCAIVMRLTRRARTRHRPGSNQRARPPRWILQPSQDKSRPRARSQQSPHCKKPMPHCAQPGFWPNGSCVASASMKRPCVERANSSRFGEDCTHSRCSGG